MPAMDTLLFNDPEVKGLAFAILEECTDLQAFGRRMLELLANAAMSAKADEACNAPYGERDEGRVNSRNGYRERGLSTAAGDVTLKIPKLRRGSFFPEDLIERYCRVDRALVAAVAEMYVMGISTRKVEAVAGELGVRSMSKSQVSRLCECLDAEVDAFRRQRFDGVRFAYLWLDATYVKCRVEGRSASQAVVTAIGLDDTGHKRFVGVDCVDTESHAGWKAFLSGLRARGVDGVRLVVSDAHEGLAKAIAETFQGAAWQRCVTHLMRNVAGRIHRKDDQRKAREAMKAVFAQKSPVLVRACYQEATEEVLKPRSRRWPTWRSRRRTGSGSAPTTSRRGPTARSSAGRASCRGSPRASRSSAWWERRSSRPTRSGRRAASSPGPRSRTPGRPRSARPPARPRCSPPARRRARS